MFLKLHGKHGPAVNKNWRACRYYTPVMKPEKEIDMPKVSSVFKSAFLRAGDMDGASVAHIISWREEIVYGNSAYVLDVEVAGARAVLRLGQMLAHDIAAALGEDDFDNWPGRAVSIYPSTLKIKDKDSGEDKIVDMIRAAAAPEGTPVKVAVPSTRQTLNDDIPF
jgi:hypothetical protein